MLVVLYTVNIVYICVFVICLCDKLNNPWNVCVCVCGCMHACMYICMHVFIYVRTYVCMPVCQYVCSTYVVVLPAYSGYATKKRGPYRSNITLGSVCWTVTTTNFRAFASCSSIQTFSVRDIPMDVNVKMRLWNLIFTKQKGFSHNCFNCWGGSFKGGSTFPLRHSFFVVWKNVKTGTFFPLEVADVSYIWLFRQSLGARH